MGRSKNKTPKANFNPPKRTIKIQHNPEDFYKEKPAWNFHTRDYELWSFSKDEIGDFFWDEVFEKICSWESMTWDEILIKSNNNNHLINPSLLNKCAQDRLEKLKIEAEGIISLRLNGKHRLYGYMIGRVFNILWYDKNHGDNNECVCRSHKKHT